MERQFAIKRFYAPVIARPEVGPRLQQAIRSYGGLDHPRIARLAEFGVSGGETFTATELVPGLDLGRLAAMGGPPLPAGAALGLVSAAARAIGFAHGRGVCHWGIAPGNLIATPDGDAKVTDFGVLNCRLGGNVTDEDGLAGRVPYLAPEQLLGEAPGAAADVFSLGVVAYELIAGVRPFGGATPHAVAHAIVSARPSPLELPRPLARVIDRCLARSPFERFPDARSLADALDAAMRLSPLVGDRRDVASRVSAAVEHLTRINEQQLSGALNFAAPSPSDRGQRSTSAALPLRPPMGPPPTPPPPTPRPTPRPARATAPPPLYAPPTNPGVDPTQPPGTIELSVGDETAPRIEPLWPPTEPVQLLTGPRARLGAAAPPPVPPTVRGPGPGPAAPPPTAPTAPPFGPGASAPYAPLAEEPPTRPRPPAPPFAPAAPPRSRRALWIALGLVTLGGAGAGVAYVVSRGDRLDDPTTGTGPTTTIDAAPPTVDAAGPTPDTDATALAVTVDAAPGAADAAPDAAPPDGPTDDTPPPTADTLVITSTPPGARVFLDGADLGPTPVSMPASSDRHALAVFAPDHALYLATVDGAGAHAAALTRVPAASGPGGIKVRCKAKRRYYVFVDGQPTGQLCPTERVPVAMGTHQVEIYDLFTEARQTGTVRVVQTSRSTRIKFD